MASKTEIHAAGIDPADKRRWLGSAQVSGKPFGQWLIDACNAAAVDIDPPWLDGLSERTRIGLLAAGFDSRESVEQARAEDFDFVALPNFGRKCEQELIEWLN
jgi:hypothetical protein